MKKISESEYIAFCDDDDIWESDKIEKQINVITTQNTDFVSSKIRCFNESGTINKIQKNNKIENLKDLINRNEINTSSVLLRKSSLVVFCEDKHLVTVEDYYLWIRLFIKGYKFSFIDEPLVRYRIGGNASNNSNHLKHLRIIILLFKIKIDHNHISIIRSTFIHLIKYIIKIILRRLCA